MVCGLRQTALILNPIHFQSTLEDMDMEDDMKTLVSDEIKRFRESYKVGVLQIRGEGKQF